MKAMFEQLDMN